MGRKSNKSSRYPVAKPKASGRVSKSSAETQQLTGLVKSEWVEVVKADTGETGLRINLERAPEPDRTLAANWIAVVEDGDDIQFVFGQRAPATTTLVGALIVAMPRASVQDALYGGNPGFLDSLSEHIAQNGFSGTLGEITDDIYPKERVVFERASLTMLAFVGPDAEMRFYRLSASDLRRLRQGQEASLIYPVVQVITSVGLFSALINELTDILQKAATPVPRDGEVTP
jgi:hypothetical protein